MSINVNNTVNMDIAKLKVRAAIGLYADVAAKKMEGAAKKDAPWADRTSNARNSIQGNFRWEGSKAKIELSGNVDYFVFLELAMGKKYSVLVPTIQRYGPEVLKGYKRVIG